MEQSQPSPFTVAYLASLSTALAPYPSLSHSASRSLSALTSSAGLATPLRRETKCAHCGAELIGGFNSSFTLTPGNMLLAECGACGKLTRRRLEREQQAERANRGRHKFARVKKKQVRLRIEAAKTRPANSVAPGPSVPLPPSEPARLSAPSQPALAPAPAPSHPRTLPSSPMPSHSPSPAPTPSPAPVTSKPAPARAGAGLATLDERAGGKKRKKGKPAGLAEMLEAKKKAAAAGAGKLGLQDFLSGI